MGTEKLAILRPSAILLILGMVLFAAAGYPAAAAPATQEGQASITSPQTGAQIAGTIQIIGSASHPQFQHYVLAWCREPVTDEGWVVFADVTTPIENGVLATWNTAQVPDGVYSLRLRVIRQDSNDTQVLVTGLNVVNSRPLETPTPPIGPTIPVEPTGVAATPTPETIVQPPTSTPQPPTPTPASGSSAGGDPLSRLDPTSFSINLDALRQSFCHGVGYTVGLFMVWGAALGLRGTVRLILRRLAQRGEGEPGK